MRVKSDAVTLSEVNVLPPPPEGHKARTKDFMGQGDSLDSFNEVLNFSNNEEISAWIWKSSCMAKLSRMDGMEEADSLK
jgi:hypothetical protein